MQDVEQVVLNASFENRVPILGKVTIYDEQLQPKTETSLSAMVREFFPEGDVWLECESIEPQETGPARFSMRLKPGAGARMALASMSGDAPPAGLVYEVLMTQKAPTFLDELL
jgi:hypothetical protein